MNWVHGLRKLGLQVYYVEQIAPQHCTDDRGRTVPFAESANVAYFEHVMREEGLAGASALVFPSLPELQALGKSLGVKSTQFAELCRDKKINDRIGKLMAEVNASLSRYEQVKRFELVPHELTVDGGEITPTLKLKRRILDKKYADLIEGMYAGGGEG